MAKLGLLFVAVFCVVQISLASRLPRETVEGSSTEASFIDKVKGSFGQLSDNISKTFTKENADKIVKSLSESVDDLTKSAKEKYAEVKKDIVGTPTDATDKPN